MKQFAMSILAAAFLFSAAQAQTTKTKDENVKVKESGNKLKVKDKTGMGLETLPYTAMYSSNFRIGNPTYSSMVLNLWKDWDDNMLDRHVNWFADTLQYLSSTGNVTKGQTNVLDLVKKSRNSFTASKTTLDAWIPLKSVDKNEDWVALWGQETDTYPDGHTDVYDLHEIWRINKDGKIDMIKQYTSKPTPRE
jgi:hypothetical protein